MLEATCEKCGRALTVYIEDRPLEMSRLVHAYLCPACRRAYEVWAARSSLAKELYMAEAVAQAHVNGGFPIGAQASASEWVAKRLLLLDATLAWLAEKPAAVEAKSKGD